MSQLKKTYKFHKGFTLLEMAIVLTIVGLMLGALVIPMAAQVSLRDNVQTKTNLGLIKEALIGYALSNGRLPCPDNDFDGKENASNSICVNYEGMLPYKTLGVEASDVWGNYYGYRVSSSFSDSHFTLASTGNITINSRGDNPNTTGDLEAKFVVPVVTTAAAVIISFGRNGYWAFNRTSNSRNDAPPSINVDEAINSMAGLVKVTRVHSDKSDDCSDTEEKKVFCEFDDVVDWVSPNILFNRMVQAGKLSINE